VLTLVEGLTRRYGEREAVRDLDVRLAAGEIYGLLGCNGAGKTTTIRMLVGLLEPTAGRVRVRGVDVWKDAVAARRATGFAPDAPLLYDRLTGREFLAFLAQLHDLSSGDAARRVADLLDEVDLSGDADRACGTYSLGMKRRLAFAAALVHRPAFLVLDEPLSGLDPRSTRRLKDRIRAVADTGTAVLLSTHDLTSAEELCDRIGVLHRGRLVAEGEASVVRSMASAPSLEAAFLALTSEELS
jgi:ABC-2 type transport system ATP-binding protein